MSTKQLTLCAILISIGIIIPIFSPIKILIEPASFTLGSHIAIFMAMFLSPKISFLVSIGTTIGFFIAGFPLTVVLRALTHIIFAYVGSIYLKKHKNLLKEPKESLKFSLFISVIHSICEVLVIIPFYFSSSLPQEYYDKGFLYGVVLLIGVGTIIHSQVDFYISRYIWNMIPQKVLSK